MKRFFFLLSLACTALSPLSSEEISQPTTNENQPATIHWYTSLKEAQEKASAENRPLYICFTGTSWCFWCQRLEKEIHSSPLFIQKTKDKFVFVTIDIPKEQTQADPEIRDLMMKYQVYGVPVILILSPSMEKLGQLSYQNISPEDFAELTLSIGYPK